VTQNSNKPANGAQLYQCSRNQKRWKHNQQMLLRCTLQLHVPFCWK